MWPGVHVQAGMIEHLRGEIDRRQIPNVSVLLSTESRVALPDETADIVFIAMVLHEVDDPVAFLGEAGRLVKRDGAIAIIEFHKRDDLVDGPPMAHRVSVGELSGLATLAGLKVGLTTDLTDRFYLTKLTRDIG
jgi:ubiquinone/menaquinone biosynthesis C-methylase UbiE